MSRLRTLAAAANTASVAAANRPDNLLSPAIKGIALGFVGGVIAILALMSFGPQLVQASNASQHHGPSTQSGHRWTR